MFRFVAAQLRFRGGRTLALLAALFAAVTSFSVLTATAMVQRMDVVGTINANARGTYDILVRPAGSTSAIETRNNLVSSTALTGLSGGITQAQWQQILKIQDIAVAAPIAVVGYSMPTVDLPVDLSEYVDPALAAQVLRVSTTQISERGLTTVKSLYRTSSSDIYSYVTTKPVHGKADEISPGLTVQAAFEIGADGMEHPICPPVLNLIDRMTNKAAPSVRLYCGTTNPDDTYNKPGPANSQATEITNSADHVDVGWSFPYLIEAVDPVQEAKLVGLDRAVSKGAYFPANATVTRTSNGDFAIPVLLANKTAVDEQLSISVSRLPADAVTQVAAGKDDVALFATLPTMNATQVGSVTVDSQQAYAALLASVEKDDIRSSLASQYLTAAPIHYTDQGSGLAAAALRDGSNPLLPEVGSYTFRVGGGDFARTGDLVDTALRALAAHPAVYDPGLSSVPAPRFQALGEFDASKLEAGRSSLGAVPMETYFAPQASGADEASRTALGGKPLLPNGNIRGLLSVAPSMITTLSSLTFFEDPKAFDDVTPDMGVDKAAPISVVRVKLNGALGTDALSRERVRLAAQRIHDATGLDVDVTLGSSPSPVTVADPAGKFGRPALNLTELWSRKGVAAVLTAAIDRKSLILFVLVLAVCALFVTGATSAAVRSRRTELAVLTCLGWPARRLFGLILAEVLAIGAVAGIAGTVAALPIGRLLGVQVSFARSTLAIPAALLLAVLASLWPAIRASRSHPGAAVTPVVSAPRRAARMTGITRLSLANLRRVPGRAVLGATALAVGVAALVGLLGIATAFHGTVTGTLLGDAISVQVRSTDYIAAGIAAALGAFTVADVLYLNIRERAAEYALLHATGWTSRALTRLVLSEAAVMAFVGSLVGAAAAVGAVSKFGRKFAGGLVAPSIGIVLGAVVITLVAAAVPAAMLRRMPAAQLLAED